VIIRKPIHAFLDKYSIHVLLRLSA